MTTENMQDLIANQLIGQTSQYGQAWHATKSFISQQNHYPEFVPVADVHNKLLNFTAVTRRPMIEHDGSLIVDENTVAVTNSTTGEVYNYFGNGYLPHQYQELLDVVQNVVSGVTGVASAGLLSAGGPRGSVFYVQLASSDLLSVGGDVMSKRFSVVSSHTGKYATQFQFSHTRFVCDNTLAVGLAEIGDKYRVRHTKNSAGRLSVQQVRDALEIGFVSSDSEVSWFDMLQNTPVSAYEAERVIDRLMPALEETSYKATVADRKRSELLSLYSPNDQRVGVFHGTAFGLWQAFNTHQNHYGQKNKRTPDGERPMLQLLDGKTAGNDRAVLSTIGDVVGRRLVGVM